MEHMQIRSDLCEIGRRMYGLRWVAANDGNMSVRVSENEILCTATGISKGFMQPEDLCLVDLDLNLLSGQRQPSSEIRLHAACYRNRPDISAVCHSHCPAATAFAAAGKALNEPLLTEVVATIGAVPLVPYGRPGSDDIWQALVPLLAQADSFLLANHGVLTVGTDCWQAFHRMECVEHFARIAINVRLLGSKHCLTQDEVDDLRPSPDSNPHWHPPACQGKDC